MLKCVSGVEEFFFITRYRPILKVYEYLKIFFTTGSQVRIFTTNTLKIISEQIPLYLLVLGLPSFPDLSWKLCQVQESNKHRKSKYNFKRIVFFLYKCLLFNVWDNTWREYFTLTLESLFIHNCCWIYLKFNDVHSLPGTFLINHLINILVVIIIVLC